MNCEISVSVGLPLVRGKSISIQSNTTTMSGADPALTASEVGEYISFDEQPGVYKIASTTELATPYYGPTIKGEFVVRPQTTRRILITGPEGELVAATATVHYWEMPEPLWHNWQVTVLPSNRALELRAMMVLMRDHQKKLSQKRDIQAEYDDGRGGGAYNDMVAAMSGPISPVIPRGMDNRRVMFGRRR